MSTGLAEVETRPVVAADLSPDNPLAMLAMALQRGHDPDKLEKLMDLCERFKAERAAEAFAVAMNECQAEMPCIVKDKDNPHTKSRYATLENVNFTIRPVYVRHGFSLSFGTADSQLADHYRIVCDVSHVGGHTKRYFLDMPADTTGAKGTGNKTGVQGVGSTVSYARRYLSLMIFNLTVANEDLDGAAIDALDTITDQEALEVEDRLTDARADRERFFDWLQAGNHLVNGERRVGAIKKKHLSAVLDALAKKARAAK